MSMDDAMIESMRRMADLDSIRLELSHIPPSYPATRQSIDAEWHIEKTEESPQMAVCRSWMTC